MCSQKSTGPTIRRITHERVTVFEMGIVNLSRECAPTFDIFVFIVLIKSSLKLARSSQLWMFCTMSSKARSIEHGRRSTSPLCSSTWSFAWISARATWPKRVSTSTRTSASRCVWTNPVAGRTFTDNSLESIVIKYCLCFQVNIKSLEDVVRAYLKLAEEKTETAKEESQQMVLDIEDLDNIQTPER